MRLRERNREKLLESLNESEKEFFEKFTDAQAEMDGITRYEKFTYGFKPGVLLRKTYLKTHRRIIYINLLTAGNLYKHLGEINAQASDMLDSLIRQMATAQGINEALKATDQMTWVGAMNNIKAFTLSQEEKPMWLLCLRVIITY